MTAYRVLHLDDDRFRDAMEREADDLVDAMSEFMLDGEQSAERLGWLVGQGMFAPVADVDPGDCDAPLDRVAFKTRNATEGEIWWEEKPDVTALAEAARSTRPGDVVVDPAGETHAMTPDRSWNALGRWPGSR